MEAANDQHFDKGDLEVLVAAIDLVDNLDAVAFAAKLARERLKYPIESCADLKPLFDDGGRARFKGREITIADAERYLPDSYFPIESERDFMCRLLIAFQRGEIAHLQEALAVRDEVKLEAGEQADLLPAPGPPGGVLGAEV